MPYSYAPGTTCLMTLIRSLPASGLTNHPVAPRRLPSACLVVSLSVVSVRIGVKRKAERARTFSINSSPPMLGMLMSVRIKSGLTPDFNLSSAAWPLLADSTLKPLMLRVVLRLISMVAESSTMRIVIAIQSTSQCWFERRPDPGAQFRVFRPTGDTRFGNHQHLKIGGMKMGAGGKIHFARGLLLQRFEQSLGLFHSHYISKDHAVSFEFDRHQTISRIFRIIKTEPSPISAEPAQMDKPERKPAIGF